MMIRLDGTNLTIEKVVDVARHNEKVMLHPKAVEKMKKCRDVLEKKLKPGR